MPVPFIYLRKMLAEAWHCRPGEIDQVRDADEIGTYMEIAELEHKYKKRGPHEEDGPSGIQLDPP